MAELQSENLLGDTEQSSVLEIGGDPARIFQHARTQIDRTINKQNTKEVQLRISKTLSEKDFIKGEAEEAAALTQGEETAATPEMIRTAYLVPLLHPATK